MTKASSDFRSPAGMAVLSRPIQNLTATGTNQATGFQIPLGQDVSIFSTVASGTAATLPTGSISSGEEYVVANHGANALLLYPPVGGSIAGLSANTATTVPANKAAYLMYIGANTWLCNMGA